MASIVSSTIASALPELPFGLPSASYVARFTKYTLFLNMDWISTVVGLTLVALIVTATVLMMRRREKIRIAARETETLNVISADTRRAFWISSADRSHMPDAFSSGGDDGEDGE